MKYEPLKVHYECRIPKGCIKRDNRPLGILLKSFGIVGNVNRKVNRKCQ